jgi:hypothetical protein
VRPVTLYSMMTHGDVIELVGQLGSVLDQVESGELPAGPDQLAWLRGAVAPVADGSRWGVSHS